MRGHTKRIWVLAAAGAASLATLLALTPASTTQQQVEQTVVHQANTEGYSFGHVTSASCDFDGSTWNCAVMGAHGEIAVAQANTQGAVFAPVGYVFTDGK